MVEIYSKVLIGKRPKNDDRTLVNDKIINDGQNIYTKSGCGIIAVFDGVGGNPNGGLAAEITAKNLICLNTKDIDEGEINKAILHAENEMFSNRLHNPSCYRMSTTAAGVWFNEHRGYIFNIGDSAVYRYRKPFLSLLTKEHTIAQMKKELGLPVTRKDENTLTRSIGSGYSKPDIQEISLYEDDIFLICSDGVSKYISDNELQELIETKSDIVELGNCIIQKALDNDSTDNLSIIVGRSIRNE